MSLRLLFEEIFIKHTYYENRKKYLMETKLYTNVKL